MIYKHYVTNGTQVVWEEGDRIVDNVAMVQELNSLNLRCDLAVWQKYSEERSALVATLFYSPNGFKVQYHAFINWEVFEKMTEDDWNDFWARPNPDDLG